MRSRQDVLFNFGQFLPKFGCHGNSLGSLEILDSTFEIADPENPTIHAKFLPISCAESVQMFNTTARFVRAHLEFCIVWDKTH